MPTAPPPHLHHYLICRSDLPWVVRCVQIAHAAGNSSPGALPANTHVVVLAVPDEAALEQAARRLLWAGVAFARVHEDDAPWDGQLMALGVAPGRREDLRRHLSGLPLLR